MPRMNPVNLESATPAAAETLKNVKQKMGTIPNIIATMANSNAVAQAYLGMSGALSQGVLSATLREQIALAVGEENECRYCLSAHTFLGKAAGLNPDQIHQARLGHAEEEKTDVALQFVVKLVEQRGHVSDQDYQGLVEAGYSASEIAEIIAVAAMNIFTNYFNHITDPQIDFPVAEAISHG